MSAVKVQVLSQEHGNALAIMFRIVCLSILVAMVGGRELRGFVDQMCWNPSSCFSGSCCTCYCCDLDHYLHQETTDHWCFGTHGNDAGPKPTEAESYVADCSAFFGSGTTCYCMPKKFLNKEFAAVNGNNPHERCWSISNSGENLPMTGYESISNSSLPPNPPPLIESFDNSNVTVV